MFEARYEQIRLLGEGSFGAAYLVRDRSNPSAIQVAKEIRLRHLTEQQRTAACAEAEVLRMMAHSNIVAYVATLLEGPTLHILMEYADGGDLATKIKERRAAEHGFREREVMFIFVQLSLALAHVHARNILHRDLKPLNVFLTLQGVVKLGDFGIARVLESASVAAQTVIGTPSYLSPEICNNQPYGVKSDLWSLGVVLYELAALRVPFYAVSLPAVVMKICGSHPEPLPCGFSSNLTDIVFGLLQKEPAERPSLDALLRSGFVQQHVEELLSHSLQCNSGGCEGLVSTDMQKPCPKPLPNRVIQRQIPDATQLPNKLSSDSPEDAARAEFFRNRNAALQAKRRAEAGAFSLAGGSPRLERPEADKRPPAGLQKCERPEEREIARSREDLSFGPDELESDRSRVVQVRQRAQEEREQRDASRKQELEKAMREARQDRMAMQEIRLARESNPIVDTPPRRSLAKPNGPSDETPSSFPQANEKENLDVVGLQQELLTQAKSRQELMDRNAKACFSTPFCPSLESEPAVVSDNIKIKQLKLVGGLEPELTLKPDFNMTIKPDVTFKPESIIDLQAGYISRQPDEICLESLSVSDGGDLLCGTSRLVPISRSNSTEDHVADTSIRDLQAVLAGVLAIESSGVANGNGNCGIPPSVCQHLDESHASLEYSRNSTELSATLLSLQSAVSSEVWLQAAAVHPAEAPSSPTPPLSTISEELSRSYLMRPGHKPGEIIIESPLPPLSPEAVSPDHDPPPMTNLAGSSDQRVVQEHVAHVPGAADQPKTVVKAVAPQLGSAVFSIPASTTQEVCTIMDVAAADPADPAIAAQSTVDMKRKCKCCALM